MHVGSNWKGFPFLFALCTSASIVIWFFVDVDKGRRDAIRFSTENCADGVRIAAVSTREAEEGLESLDEDKNDKS